jgi:hypothetical protein
MRIPKQRVDFKQRTKTISATWPCQRDDQSGQLSVDPKEPALHRAREIRPDHPHFPVKGVLETMT